MIAEGRYLSRATGWTWATAKNGNLYISIEFSIDGQSIVADLHLTPNARKRAFESLRYLGFEGDDLAAIDTNVGGLDANEVELDVGHEEQTDEDNNPILDESGAPKQRARVRWINRPGGLRAKVVPPREKVAALAASLRGALMAVPAVTRPGTSAGARPTATTTGTAPTSPLPAALDDFGKKVADAKTPTEVATLFLDHREKIERAKALEAAWRVAKARALTLDAACEFRALHDALVEERRRATEPPALSDDEEIPF